MAALGFSAGVLEEAMIVADVVAICQISIAMFDELRYDPIDSFRLVE